MVLLLTGPMTKQFDPDEALTAALDSVAGRLESHETRVLRAGQAARYRMLAEAYDIACESAASNRRRPSPVQATDLAFRAVRAELATVLRLSERTIERQLNDAHILAHDYPAVLDSLASGTIGDGHAKVVMAAGEVIGFADDPSIRERRSLYVDAVLVFAAETTPARLRPIAERLAEQFSERTIDERHEEAMLGRAVIIRDLRDGMSELFAVLPSTEAHAIHDRLTRMAKRLELVDAAAAEDAAAEARATRMPAPKTPRVPRDHRRADLLSDILVHADPESLADASRVKAIVHLTVTDETLFSQTLRLDDRRAESAGVTSLVPAELSGCGPIDTAAARKLVVSASKWHLVHHDEHTGEAIRVEEYSPSLSQRRFLLARDQHCRFPGCRVAAHRCDIDHTRDHAKGGATATDNLGHLCRGHHMLKHHGGWSVKQHPGGTLEWRSPTGRVYTDRPPSRVRFEIIAKPEAKHKTEPARAHGYARAA